MATSEAGLDAGNERPPPDAALDASWHDDSDVDDAGSDGDKRDAELDSAAGDATPESDGAPWAQCEERAQIIESFVAAHRSCQRDADCVIVGNCGHADFKSVARAFEAEAEALVLGNPCGAQDGPTYQAVCRAGSCERERSPIWCGPPPQTECPDGMSRFQAGCGSVAATFRDGCHAPCSGNGDDAACGAGFSCQPTTTDPCGIGLDGNATCAACGLESWLCLPAPACEVELSLAFDGRSVLRVAPTEAAQLQLWLQNLTDHTITFSFDAPCHGPRVQGLADFDVWQACLAGACPMDPVHSELTLAPGEKRLWKSAVLALDPSDCNADGLPSGRYAPTFALSNVQGARSCGPAPTLLLTGSEALQ